MLQRRDRRQAAGEGRLVRRRKILEHAARQGHRKMRVDVGKARHHELAGSVDKVCRREPRRDFDIGPDRRDASAFDGDRGAVKDRIAVVDGHNRGILNDNGHGLLHND